jgi:uncharacterized DUF497 family protein
MIFDFDPAKSIANKQKHGIDFVEAQALWQDKRKVTLPARSVIETRMAIVGLIDEKLWVAFVTIRGGAIRVISVRRARTKEEYLYEKVR